MSWRVDVVLAIVYYMHLLSTPVHAFSTALCNVSLRCNDYAIVVMFLHPGFNSYLKRCTATNRVTVGSLHDAAWLYYSQCLMPHLDNTIKAWSIRHVLQDPWLMCRSRSSRIWFTRTPSGWTVGCCFKNTGKHCDLVRRARVGWTSDSYHCLNAITYSPVSVTGVWT